MNYIDKNSEFWPVNHFKNVPEKDLPSKIYYKGDISLLKSDNNIAVVGSREIDKSIELRERKLVRYLVNKGMNIVSGLALGCDTIAHDETIKAGGKTIAIVSTKLNSIYPKENSGLAEKIVQSGGLIISEYDDYNSKEFVKRLIDRDRLQAMFSNAVIACAGEAGSGTRHAMNKANAYNIPTFVIYNEVEDKDNPKFGLARKLLAEQKTKIAKPSDLMLINSNFHFVKGDLFDYDVDAIINTVNCVGVMGAGLAKEFKIRYPKNFAKYKTECNQERVVIGKMLTFEEDGKFIINFPTKQHFKHKSKMSYVEDGLDDLINIIKDNNIKSIAIPALGAGLGGLDFNDVKKVIITKLNIDDLKDVEFYIFEPK